MYNSRDFQQQITPILKELAQTIGVTSVWLCHFDFTKNVSITYAEYVQHDANILEATTDLGEAYPEHDMEWVAWLQRAEGIVEHVHIDELARDDPDWAEYIAGGAHSVGYYPIFVSENVWGYLEFWESRQKRHFNDSDTQHLQHAAQQLAQVIEQFKSA